MPEKAQKSTSSTMFSQVIWTTIALLGTAVAVLLIWRWAPLWNSRHDFSEALSQVGSGEEIEIPFAKGLTAPESPDSLLMDQEISNYLASPSNSSDLARILSKIPDQASLTQEIIRRTTETLNTLPPEIGSGPARFLNLPVPLFASLANEGRFWAILAESQLEKRPPQETVTMLLGVALLGYQIEVSEGRVLAPTLMGRMVGYMCREIATTSLLRLAQRLPLNRSDARLVMKHLLVLENHPMPVADFLKFYQDFSDSILSRPDIDQMAEPAALAYDFSSRRQLRAAAAALALVSHHFESGHWATSPTEISEWLEEPWPSDPVPERGPFLLIPGAPPKILSSGDDGKPQTPDDEQLFPLLLIKQ